LRLLGALLCFAAAVQADVRLPKYTRQQLPNGVVVFLVPRAGVPLVTFAS